MDSIRDSPFGLIVRFITKNKYFKHEEELDTFKHPYYHGPKEAIVEGNHDLVSPESSSIIAAVSEDDVERQSGSEIDENIIHRLVTLQSQHDLDEKYILVDWYTTGMLCPYIGKHLSLRLLLQMILKTHRIGVSRRRSLLHLWFVITPSSSISDRPYLWARYPRSSQDLELVSKCHPSRCVYMFLVGSGFNRKKCSLYHYFIHIHNALDRCSNGQILSRLPRFSILDWCLRISSSCYWRSHVWGHVSVDQSTIRFDSLGSIHRGGTCPGPHALSQCPCAYIIVFLCTRDISIHDPLLPRSPFAQITGDDKYRTKEEIDRITNKKTSIFWNTISKPTEINVLDPAVLFSTIYTSLIYAIFYPFFESFRIIFQAVYHFSFILVPLFERQLERKGLGAFGAPERRLVPGLLVCTLTPIGLFITAWSSRPSVHWMVPILGLFLNIIGTFTVIVCMLQYLAFSYPRYAASLFAANDFARSTLAAGAIMFSRFMFINLGLDWGISLLAFLDIICVVLLFGLWKYGGLLRAKSRFAES
ncbi:MFS transporter, putative [Talaromyces stipitatus ATCC 10500]|uniref:MFS transporter, putative n=1 Tax=Talaromyces stipitatus (strain ATCC 10500 / CBS 375.48 / QM 6759 / NRRL 1006) TaxID=441959 RepID=B8MSZ1_TALSN|nr:MFS transporter, putative [Talaromyces stipitatus ATCC 10500]EED12147.1 MFS transporter, putative [Talaromyces stipitatus ATCC 10500]